MREVGHELGIGSLEVGDGVEGGGVDVVLLSPVPHSGGIGIIARAARESARSHTAFFFFGFFFIHQFLIQSSPCQLRSGGHHPIAQEP